MPQCGHESDGEHHCNELEKSQLHQPVCRSVCFAGVPVDGKDWHEDLAAMEEEATLVVT